MRSDKTSKLTSGFTLIEMMIAMTILAFIALAVYNNTVQTYKLRDNVEQEGDFFNALRVTLDLMGRDIGQMYSPKIAALPGESGKAQSNTQQNSTGTFASNGASADPTEFWGSPINQFGVRPSRLQGEATKLMFVSNGHMRLFRDSHESDFAKITYALEEDSDKANSRKTTLVKRENTAAFDDEEKKEDEVRYPLLTNVKKLEFSFLDGEKDQWHPRWDTASADHKDKFPDVIQVTIEVNYPNSEAFFTVIQRFRPEMLGEL